MIEQPPPDQDVRAEPAGWLAAPVVAILALLCCAGPFLIVALAATGVGAWLGTHGWYTLGAIVLVGLALGAAARHVRRGQSRV